MCSASSAGDGARPDLYESVEIEQNLTVDPFDTVVWQPDDPDFSPSTTDPDQSIPASMQTAALLSKHRPSPSMTDHERSEEEDALKDALKDQPYLSNLSNMPQDDVRRPPIYSLQLVPGTDMNLTKQLTPATYQFTSGATRSESFSGPSAMDPPALIHDSSSSSNPDVGNYTHNPAAPMVPGGVGVSAMAIKTEEADRRGAAGIDQTPEKNPRGGSTRTLSHRERNRIAAHKCRQKNKQNIQALQEQERHLAQENKFLAEHAHHLKNEVLGLRNEILNHGNCDDELIQNYITESAKKLQQ